MITVGVKVKGESSIKPVAGLELKFCPTYKALEKYDIKLLENVKKDDIDKVKALKGQVYSIGAVDSDIKLITLYISSVDEILGEKFALQQEKQRSIEAIKQTAEEKIQLSRQVETQSSNIKELRERVSDLRQKVDQRDARINELENQVTTITDKLSAEVKLRQQAERDRKAFQDQLAQSLSDNVTDLTSQKSELTNMFDQEIAKVKDVITQKEEVIKSKDDKIAELEKLNSELSKSGSIPDIPYEYTGAPKIVGVTSHGSYGVSDTVYTMQDILAQTYNILVIDFDLRGNGHLGTLLSSENHGLEEVLNGKELTRDTILNDGERRVDYIGGVTKAWNVYDILNLPFDKLFEGDYDFIICDLGIHGGYNIQTKLNEMIMRIGKIVNLYIREDKKMEEAINVRNYSRDGRGIPFVSRIMAEELSLNDDNLSKQYIHELVVNPVLDGRI